MLLLSLKDETCVTHSVKPFVPARDLRLRLWGVSFLSGQSLSATCPVLGSGRAQNRQGACYLFKILFKVFQNIISSLSIQFSF